MIEENSQKNKSSRYHVRSITQVDWSKTAKHFSVNAENFLAMSTSTLSLSADFPHVIAAGHAEDFQIYVFE